MACCTPLSYLLARMWSAGAAHPAMLGRKVVSCSQPDWQRPRRSEEAKKRESPSSFSHHRNASSSSCQWILGMSSIWMWLLADLFSWSPERVFFTIWVVLSLHNQKQTVIWFLIRKNTQKLNFPSSLARANTYLKENLVLGDCGATFAQYFLTGFWIHSHSSWARGRGKAQKKGA